MDQDLVASLGTALAVGLLVGLERQIAMVRKEAREVIGGVRTFPLIAVAGALSTLLGRAFGVPLVGAALIALVALVALHRFTVLPAERESGITTEVAALVTWLLGALATATEWTASLVPRLTTVFALAVVVTLLLSIKPKLHAIVARVSEEDVFATLQLLVVAIVLLPLLPDQGYGPYDAFNPQQVGRMVLFIGAVSFTGYAASRLLGPGRGLTITGLVGGLVSSTAVTFAMARRAKASPGDAAACALAVISASTMMFLRILAAAGVVYAPLVPRLALPLGMMAVGGVVLVLVIVRRARHSGPAGDSARAVGDAVPLTNPFELTSALTFGALFAGVTLVVKAASATVGNAALFGAAVLAGTTDVDAITLSMATLAKDGLALGTATTAIIIAAFANTAVKAGIAWVSGGAAFGRRVGLAYALMAALGAVGVLVQGLAWRG